METRTRILENSLKLFAEKGFDGVGIQEIVDISGVTKPTLYYFYGSKLGLLQTLLSEKTSSFLINLKSTATYHGDLIRSLTQIVQLYFEFARSNPEFYRFLVGLNFSAPESEASKAAKLIWREQYDLINEMFVQAALQHGNLIGKDPTLTFTLIGLINNYLTLYFQGLLDLKDEMVHQAVKQYMYGIFS